MKNRARGLFIACLLLCCARPFAAAQDASRVSVLLDGTEAFGHILHSCGLMPVASMGDLWKLPADKTLVVIFGDLKAFESLNREFQAFDEFRRQGGALLVASDFRANQACRRFDDLRWLPGDCGKCQHLSGQVEHVSARHARELQGRASDLRICPRGSLPIGPPIFARTAHGSMPSRPSLMTAATLTAGAPIHCRRVRPMLMVPGRRRRRPVGQ